MKAFAEIHLAEHPREIGGDNSGAWVRLYMKGNEGAPWSWCAGFVTFLLHQASELMNVPMPITGSFSCDMLSIQAQSSGLYISESRRSSETLKPGSVFLVRRTSTDWTHTGIVTNAKDISFDTVEGNTNDDGVANGYEVCKRSRGYTGRDFIVF